jgi:hypothetical protein
LEVGTFVVLKNGLFGPVVSLVDPADRAEAPQAYDYDFDILPLNELPDDEYPAKFEDVVWMTPSQVKVTVTLETEESEDTFDSASYHPVGDEF